DHARDPQDHLGLVADGFDDRSWRARRAARALIRAHRLSRALALDLNAPEEQVEPDVVDALECAGDEERGAEGAAEGGAGDERGYRSGQVAGGVGVGGGRGALARLDDGHYVRLPGGHVRLGEQEAGKQERDRAWQVGREGDADEEK